MATTARLRVLYRVTITSLNIYPDGYPKLPHVSIGGVSLHHLPRRHDDKRKPGEDPGLKACESYAGSPLI